MAPSGFGAKWNSRITTGPLRSVTTHLRISLSAITCLPWSRSQPPAPGASTSRLSEMQGSGRCLPPCQMNVNPASSVVRSGAHSSAGCHQWSLGCHSVTEWRTFTRRRQVNGYRFTAFLRGASDRTCRDRRNSAVAGDDGTKDQANPCCVDRRFVGGWPWVAPRLRSLASRPCHG